MKAAIVKRAGTNPVYESFKEPIAQAENVKIDVTAAALSNLTKMQATGKHYSSKQNFPLVAGNDGVGILDGQRVYFASPTAPYGSLSEQTLVNKNLVIPLPAGIDDITAAAIANPGMSSWVALVSRAKFQAGQTVLINGATGSAGSLAVKIAYHLGAKKVIVTGRNTDKLSKLAADEMVSFDMDAANGSEEFTNNLIPYFSNGIDVVLDYLWGDSSLAIMKAVAVSDAKNVTRFVSIGAASGQREISLPSAYLRSSKIEILGSGLKSASLSELLSGIKGVFDWAAKEHITIPTTTFDLENVADAWQAPLTPRAVVKVQ